MFATPAHGRPATGRAPGGRGFRTGRWRSRVSGHPEVRSELPVAALAEEIETPGPGRIRALITNCGNPVRSCPDSERLDAAIASLEFMVSVDIYVNETSRHADVILPSPSALAKPHFDLAFYGLSIRNVVNYSPPIHPADGPGEPGMDEHEMLARLVGICAGLGADGDPEIVYSMILDTLRGDTAPADTAVATDPTMSPLERILDEMLRQGAYPDLDLARLRANPHGIDLGPLQPRITEILRTVSGRVELLAAPLRDDVSRLEAILDAPADDRLLLVGRRHLRSNNSWMHNLTVLTKGRTRCTLQIHPSDAAAAGLGESPTVVVTSDIGEITALVEITDEVAPGTVSLPHGWGHDVDGVRMAVARGTAGPNSNALTSSAVIDPLSGNARLNAIPVTIAPANHRPADASNSSTPRVQ